MAYAISIHKSQGQTLETVCTSLDTGEIFAYGQAYVALSRVKNFNGLYLEKFDKSSIKADPRVISFYKALDASFTAPSVVEEVMVTEQIEKEVMVTEEVVEEVMVTEEVVEEVGLQELVL
jgi:hypothetical protein